MRWTWWVVALLSGVGCGRIGFDPQETAWLDGFDRRKPITIAPVAAEVLRDIPISVIVARDDDLVAGAQLDGSDLVFADRTGTILPSELVRYDGALGELDSWVAVSELGPTDPLTIYLYYGGPPALRTTPWSASTFTAVWHMDLAGSTVTDTAGVHPAIVLASPESPSPTPGIAGRACDFDGVDDALFVGDPADGSLDVGLRSFAYATWVLAGVGVTPYDTPFHKGGSSGVNAGYDFELGTGAWYASISDGALSMSGFGVEADFQGRWTHLVGVIDRDADRFETYVNGSVLSSAPLDGLGSLDTTDPLRIGRDIYFFHGVIDEPRVYQRALSADWIATEYANLADRDAMITIGAEQRVR